jgi:TfoX/Sxy family transcriptional regulator of competence genes
MAFDEALAERVRHRLRDTDGITEKRMFGGLVFLTNGNITVGVYGDDLLARVGPDGADRAVGEPGVRPFSMGGRTSAGSILVAGTALDDEALDGWLRRAAAHAATLPPK